MKTKEKAIQKMFDSIANYYDLANSVLSVGRDRYWRNFTAQIVKTYHPQEILDICVGTGMLSLAIARAIKDCQIVGIDFSEMMLKKGEKRLARFPERDFISLKYGNAMDIDFAEDSFDCTTLAFSLRNVPDILHVLDEMKRVVRPGGAVISLELSKPENTLFRNIYYLYFYRLVPLLGKLISGRKQAYRYLPNSLTNFPDRSELEVMFKQVGLVNVRSYPLTGGIVAVHVGEKPLE